MKCSCEMEKSCVDIVPIFNGLSVKEKEDISNIATNRLYKKGEMIYQASEQVDKLYIVHIGKIKILRISPEGKEQVIRILGPGEFLGELSLFSTKPKNDYAEVIEDSRMCILEGYKLKKYIEKYPQVAFKIIDELSKRLEVAEELIESINLHSVESRLAQILLKLANKYNVIELEMSKGNFASQIGMSQETLSRKLSLFQEQGLVKLIGQRKIAIINKNGLENIV